MANGDWLLVAVVIGGFAVGYLVVAYAVRRIREANREEKWSSSWKYYCGGDETGGTRGNTETEEERARRVLGLEQACGVEDIKRAYRKLLLKYHPDKVSHLGGEFRELAEMKTREITAAYEHLRKKYGFR